MQSLLFCVCHRVWPVCEPQNVESALSYTICQLGSVDGIARLCVVLLLGTLAFRVEVDEQLLRAERAWTSTQLEQAIAGSEEKENAELPQAEKRLMTFGMLSTDFSIHPAVEIGKLRC